MCALRAPAASRGGDVCSEARKSMSTNGRCAAAQAARPLMRRALPRAPRAAGEDARRYHVQLQGASNYDGAGAQGHDHQGHRRPLTAPAHHLSRQGAVPWRLGRARLPRGAERSLSPPCLCRTLLWHCMPAAALLGAFLPDGHTGGREPCMQVLKDALMLSEQKGVLDGGSVVHMIGRPPEAEGTLDICARFHSTVCRAPSPCQA